MIIRMRGHTRQSARRMTLWSMVLIVLLLLPALVHGELLAPCASDKDCDRTSEECSGNDKCMPKTCTGSKGTCIDYDSGTYCNAAYSCVRRLSAGDMCSTLKGKNDPVYMNANQCQDGLTCDAASSKCILSGRSTNTTSTTSSSSSRTALPTPSNPASTPTSSSNVTNSTAGSTVDNAGSSSSGLTMAQILIIVAAVVAGLLLVVFAIRWRRNPKAAQDARHSPVPAQVPAVSQESASVNAAAAGTGSPAGTQLVSAKATPQAGLTAQTTAHAAVGNVNQPMMSVVVVETVPPQLPARDNRHEIGPESPVADAHRDLPPLPGSVAVAVDPDPLFLPTSGLAAAVPDPDPLYLPTTPAAPRQPVEDDELFLPPSQNAPRS
ncbi:hypothetical protein AMAG_10575 [Allomyces macrogynus ATCC 38327]|uniref:Dickkopf N-terminal cysteine-rich domain-containing protein n=1 Tax=Allomyces macrogynus (strain ATCC 38327) TaxID=578462 RepID=A0A0L0SRB2_ALLM3|nr:hypothetical protein AMAG_10575 [Allomyces macrogynus ATCC 38327]|eukprot:KNE64909.1 hypothetical protein AMAG_10575 [Allomyces macrogynus ATCC 38327]